MRFAVLFLGLALAAQGQDATSRIRAQIEALRESSKAKPDDNTQQMLKAAGDELEAGRLYVSLERLAQALDYFRGARSAADLAGTVNDGLPAFEAEWQKVRHDLEGLTRDLQTGNWTASPAAVRALAEVAAVKAVPLADGGRGFAMSTRPADGLFYLGQAQGEAEFARWCASLKIPRKGREATVRSLLPELLALQQQVNGAFQPPRSIELHSRFIALNATLKLARELDSAGLYHGALYAYLEAVRHFGMLDAPAAETDITQLRKRLQEYSNDDSIAQIFLERAESYLAHGSAR